MSTPTVRRFPRSLAQAFPREHANPIEFYPATTGRLRRWALAASIGAALALCLVFSI